MNLEKKRQSDFFYLLLAALFISSLVACNLIFQKFISFSPFQFLQFGAVQGSAWHAITSYTFEISVGLIPYPITFLVTDLISEIYGKRKANNVVIAGLVASVFVFLIVIIANLGQATPWSPIGNNVFTDVFGLTGVAVLSSMLAYLLAQFIDIRIFHFWKRLTKGKKLWLRNNFSTIPSQFVDTMTVLLLLCSYGAIQWDKFWILFLSGFLYKILVALLDTPLFYLFTHMARTYFRLDAGEEMLD